MAEFTPNYNLKKPLGNENFNRLDQNGNMDLIDEALKGLSDDKLDKDLSALTSKEAPVDNDLLVIQDSADNGTPKANKKLSFLNFKTWLEGLFLKKSGGTLTGMVEIDQTTSNFFKLNNKFCLTGAERIHLANNLIYDDALSKWKYISNGTGATMCVDKEGNVVVIKAVTGTAGDTIPTNTPEYNVFVQGNDFKTYISASYTDSIDAGATLTKSISIGNNKTFGSVVIYNTGEPYYAIKVDFTTANTKSIVFGFIFFTGSGSLGSVWTRNKIGKISNNVVYSGNTAYYGYYSAGSSEKLLIDECYINGTNLEIVFRNTHTSALSLNCTIEGEVW